MSAHSPNSQTNHTGTSGHPEQTVRRRRMKLTTEKRIADDEFMAAAIGDVEWLKQSFKDAGPVVNYDKNGLAAIHLAAIHGRLDCLKMCIDEFKIDIDLPSTTGWRAVHLCITKQTGKRSLHCLAYLIEKGANCSVANDNGITPAHQAASEGHELCLKMLLEANAKLDCKDCRGNTPLDLAKLWGHRKCARILAAEMWHQNKDYVAKEMLLLKKVKMHQVLNEFEEEEKVKDDRQIYGDAAFKQWLTNKTLGEKLTELAVRPNFESNKESVYKANSVAREMKGTEAQNKSKIKIPVDVRNQSNGLMNKAMDENIGKEGFHENHREKEKPEVKKSVKWVDNSTYQFQSHWNKSTKTIQNQYVPNLEDDFPRDEYTLMPQVKGAPKFFQGKFAHTLMPDTIDEDVKKKGSSAKLRKPNLPAEVINSVLSPDSVTDRGMIFKCKHIEDIHMKKKFDIDHVGRCSEAALHLTNDINSFLVRNSVIIKYTIPKISSKKSDRESKYAKSDRGSKYAKSDGESKYAKSDRESKYAKSDKESKYAKSDRESKYAKSDRGSKYAISQWTDDNFPLPEISRTLQNMSMPTHFPNMSMPTHFPNMHNAEGL